MSNRTMFQTPVLKLIEVKLTYSIDQQGIPNFWTALFKGNLR